MEINAKVAKWLENTVVTIKQAAYVPSQNLRPWLDPKEFFTKRFNKKPEDDATYFDEWVKRLSEYSDKELLNGIMDAESKAVYEELKAKADSKNKPANVVDINTVKPPVPSPSPEVKKEESKKEVASPIAPTAEVKKAEKDDKEIKKEKAEEKKEKIEEKKEEVKEKKEEAKEKAEEKKEEAKEKKEEAKK